MGGAEAVRAGVAAAEDDDVLVLGGDELLLGTVSPRLRLFCQRQVIHRQVNALELTAGDRAARAPSVGAAAEDDRVEIAAQVFDLDVVRRRWRW